MSKEHKCDICGRPLHRKIVSYGVVYCEKHYRQFKKYGHCLDTNPRTIYDKNDFKVVGDTVIMDLYDKHCNKVAEVKFDLEDLPKVRYYKWRLKKPCYAIANSKNGKKTVFLQRVILGVDSFVDHINGDGLDNRKKNLRVCTKSENGMNKPAKGWSKRAKGDYEAHIKKNQKAVNLGVYSSEDEARYARWYAEKILFKEFKYPSEEPELSDRRKEEIKEFVLERLRRNKLLD